jgi:hypothetical protein
LLSTFRPLLRVEQTKMIEMLRWYSGSAFA